MHMGYDTRRFLHQGSGGVPGNWRGRLPFLELRLGGYLFFFVSRFPFLFRVGSVFLVCFILVYGFHVWMCNAVWIYPPLCLIPALVAVTTAVTPGRRWDGWRNSREEQQKDCSAGHRLLVSVTTTLSCQTGSAPSGGIPRVANIARELLLRLAKIARFLLDSANRSSCSETS